MINTTDAHNTHSDHADIHHSLGLLTRQLHDALNGLGMMAQVKALAGEIPDARSRLSYIARLTGEAADKVLNMVDAGKEQQAVLTKETQSMTALLRNEPDTKLSDPRVVIFLNNVEHSAESMDHHLTNIMMAQDFHDLTSQVVAKVISLTANIETQLVQLLIQTAPTLIEVETNETVGPLNVDTYKPIGPAIHTEDKTNVVANQSEVDDLLASLGF